ncbi:MAG TPA: CBS domain-containing protein [Bdellovibrionota bacterium]|nr:CBS domain-containing protein [Bdellovibrionota bacterium]
MRVRDKMQTELFTVSPVDEINVAVEMMSNNRIRHVLVTDGENDLLGIISDRDIKSHLSLGTAPPDEAELDKTVDYYSFHDYSTVDEIMTLNPITIDPDDDIIEAARIMVSEKIGALPALENDKVVGVITETDILEAFLEMLERESLTGGKPLVRKPKVKPTRAISTSPRARKLMLRAKETQKSSKERPRDTKPSPQKSARKGKKR